MSQSNIQQKRIEIRWRQSSDRPTWHTANSDSCWRRYSV